MSEQPRDWDRELADIDKVIAQQQGNAPAARLGTGAGRRPCRRRPADGAGRPRRRGGVRSRSPGSGWLLARRAGGGAAVWPYQRACGLSSSSTSARRASPRWSPCWARWRAGRHRAGRRPRARAARDAVGGSSARTRSAAADRLRPDGAHLDVRGDGPTAPTARRRHRRRPDRPRRPSAPAPRSPHRAARADAAAPRSRTAQAPTRRQLPALAEPSLPPQLSDFMAKTFKNFIGGEWVRAAERRLLREPQPGRHRRPDRALSRFRRGATSTRAVRSAKRGFALWSRTPAPARGDVLRRVGDLLVERKEAIADAMTREMGKVLAETRGDVQEGIDTAYYAATEGRRLFGHTVPSRAAEQVGDELPPADRRRRASSRRSTSRWRSRPGRCFPRCSAGTRCIFKPAEDVPHTVHLLVEILLEAGLPPEVDSAGARARRDGRARRWSSIRDVPVISFTGSTETGRDRRRDLRPHAQAAVARDGRQERDDRDGRRRSRSGARRRALGRVRHDGPALHRHQPADPAPEDPRPLPAPPGRRGARA